VQACSAAPTTALPPRSKANEKGCAAFATVLFSEALVSTTIAFAVTFFSNFAGIILKVYIRRHAFVLVCETIYIFKYETFMCRYGRTWRFQVFFWSK
jgi:hypothetical protein